MKITLRFCLFLLALCCNEGLMAQLVVVNGSNLGMTPAQFVQNWLVGPGVIISNVTYNGSSNPITSDQIGSFTTAGIAFTQLGLDAGLILTNGQANLTIGPNNSPGAGANTDGPGDPDLTILAGDATHDKAVIEFDFVPLFDTIKFNYVFGSEEFYEYCYQFNDAFGFFLSGPGISGPFSNNSANIALMPGSLNPVTINNICANPPSAWNNTGGAWFQYDALTYVFTAKRVVTPCSTYHIKLAIADALDHVLDAGVFLEKGSFASSNLTVEITYQLGDHAIEGCKDATVHFIHNTLVNIPDTINFTVGGTAINCADYACIPTSVIIPALQTSTNLVIHALNDSITEGTETIILGVQKLNCANLAIFYDTVFIDDYTPVTLLVSNDTTTCFGDSVILHVVPQGGLFPYQYLWSNGSNKMTCTVLPPVGVNNYTITVTDTCGNSKTDTITVTTNAVGNPFIKGNNNACVGNGFTKYITEQGMINYFWTISNGGVINFGQGTNQIQVIWNTTGSQWVSVSYYDPGGCTGTASTSFPVIVFPSPDPAGMIQGDSLVCAGANGVLFSVPPIPFATNYTWTFPPGTNIISGDGTNAVTVNFGTDALSGDVIVYGTNFCGAGPPSPIFKVTVYLSPVAFAGPDCSSCEGMPFIVTQATASNFSSIKWISSGQGILTGDTTLGPKYYPDSSETGSVVFTLIVTGVCGNDTSRMILNIITMTTAYAGQDMSTCDTTPVRLSGSVVSHEESLSWRTSGTGTFDDPTILHPAYTPGVEDIINGYAVLTLIAASATPCPPDSGSMILHISTSPVANAGPELSTCGAIPVIISESSATNYFSLEWTSSGSGSFNDPSALHPVYTPDYYDIKNGQVILTLIATSGKSCRDDTAHLMLKISQPAELNAGSDTSVCRNTSFTVSDASAKNYTSITWTHNGKGILSGINTLSPVYMPGKGDTGTVTLTMTVDQAPPCMAISGQMHLSITEEPVVSAGPDQTIPYGTYATLSGEATGGSENYTYEWQPAGLLMEFFSKDPETVKLIGDTTFVLSVTDKMTGCSNSDSVRIKVGMPEKPEDCLIFYNVITPNGDGTNDTWIIDCIGEYPDNEVLIFNRWGEEVNSFKNYNNTTVIWTGTNIKGERLPDGTYYFVFSGKDVGTRTGWVYVRGN